MKNNVKRRILAGETVTAAWLELGSPDVAEILVRSGWDVVLIDCEHGVAGLEKGLDLIRAVEAAGGDAILRVPDAQEATLKRALDRGARSLVVPMINSVEQARAVAQACRYAPMGRRGYAAPIVRASGFGEWTTYAREANEEVMIAIQIEHRDALPHVAAFAGIEGIDMGFVGPNDLAASMGHLEALEAPEVLKAIEKVESDARAAGFLLGTIEGARDSAGLRDAGYRLVVGPNDVHLLARAAAAAAKKRDAALGHDRSAERTVA
ncbi:HpcH/HpaI aldolase family protein [Oceaniglobus roseus]|uniref:HpcH/HpaI aldolase family protein n=1 Tax=Oceaniglobus roseus TaxID=1737570 RepID=UPI000C7EB267|nr:aldolase/citrate lyase family protein [Kandeliimicrobium roseum]